MLTGIHFARVTDKVRINDVYSLKKEVAVGQIDSSIPLKMYHNRQWNARAALDECIDDLKRSRTLFLQAERQLLGTDQYKQLDCETQ